MSKIQRISASNKPTKFPCWVYIEGAGITLWGYWNRCETEGHYLMETYCEDSSPGFCHPDQPEAPESPYAKERAMA